MRSQRIAAGGARRAEVAVEPFPVAVRYRSSEGGESRDATFRGLLLERSEAAVLRRLREAHRFAGDIEVVEVRRRDARAQGSGS